MSSRSVTAAMAFVASKKKSDLKHVLKILLSKVKKFFQTRLNLSDHTQ